MGVSGSVSEAGSAFFSGVGGTVELRVERTKHF